MKIMENNSEQIIKMIDWINQQDLFWLKKFKLVFGVTDKSHTTKKSSNFHYASDLINELKKDGYIQCCENKGSEKQYMVIKKSVFDNLRIGKRGDWNKQKWKTFEDEIKNRSKMQKLFSN